MRFHLRQSIRREKSPGLLRGFFWLKRKVSPSFQSLFVSLSLSPMISPSITAMLSTVALMAIC